jgi:hypothetical protein
MGGLFLKPEFIYMLCMTDYLMMGMWIGRNMLYSYKKYMVFYY